MGCHSMLKVSSALLTCTQLPKSTLEYQKSIITKNSCHTFVKSCLQNANIQSPRNEKECFRQRRYDERMCFGSSVQLACPLRCLEENRSTFFSSHQEWSHNQIIASELAILGHVLFPRNFEGVDTRLLEFKEQIRKRSHLIPALLLDTFSSLKRNIGSPNLV